MATVLEAQAVISAVDRTGGVFAAIANKIRAMQSAAKAVKSAGNVGADLATVAKAAEHVGRKITAIGRASSLAVTVPTVLAAKRGYDTVLAYEKELAKAQALGELNAEQAKLVDKDARTIGATTQYTSKQALEMIRTYIQAGRSVEQARGMTKPTLDFALFGDVDPKAAADTVTSIASAYRLTMRNAEEAAKVARYVGDVIAKSANISRADVGDLAQGFKYAAPMAKLAGISMEELAAAIATMSNNGQRGDEAGVAMRSMLVRMVAPTNKAVAAMAELGLSFEQFAKYKPIGAEALVASLEAGGIAAGQFRSQIEKIVGNKKLKRGDMVPRLVETLIKGSDQDTPEQRSQITEAVNAYLLGNTERIDLPGLVQALINKRASAGSLARIFDQRQGSRIATLLTPDYFKNVQTLLNEAPGAAGRGAAKMEEGLYGAHQRFLSAMENLTLSLAKSGVIDTVTNALNSLAQGINSLAETSPKTLEFATYAAMAAAAAGPLAIALGGLTTALGGLGTAAAVLLNLLRAAPAVPVATTAIPAGAAAALGGGLAGETAIGAATAGAVAGRVGMLGAGATMLAPAAIAGALLFLHDQTKQYAGMTNAERARASRGGRSVGQSIRDDADSRYGAASGVSSSDIAGALKNVKATVEGPVTAELTGNATITNTITVSPSPDFLTRIQTMINSAINAVRVNGAPATGSSGATGRAMPEAAPGAPSP